MESLSAVSAKQYCVSLYSDQIEQLKSTFPAEISTSRLIRIGLSMLIEAKRKGEELPNVR